VPTYDYECTKCSRMFEVYQSITAPVLRKIKTECDKCNNKAPVKRLIGTGSAVLFKGDGFYQTDYRSADYKKAAKADKDAGSKSSDKDGSSTKTTKSKDESKPAKKKESAKPSSPKKDASS